MNSVSERPLPAPAGVPQAGPGEGSGGVRGAESLAGGVDREADAYRALGTPLGGLIAGALDELALKVRLTGAATPDEYEGRVAVLDDDIRRRWEDIGYENGRREGCRCGERL